MTTTAPTVDVKAALAAEDARALAHRRADLAAQACDALSDLMATFDASPVVSALEAETRAALNRANATFASAQRLAREAAVA